MELSVGLLRQRGINIKMLRQRGISVGLLRVRQNGVISRVAGTERIYH
jgi:hypothetical protein